MALCRPNACTSTQNDTMRTELLIYLWGSRSGFEIAITQESEHRIKKITKSDVYQTAKRAKIDSGELQQSKAGSNAEEILEVWGKP